MKNSDEEIVVYLQYLIAHKADCKLDRCPSCGAIQTVLDSIRYRIFEAPAAVAEPMEPASPERGTIRRRLAARQPVR
jgi:hypothetical protein